MSRAQRTCIGSLHEACFPTVEEDPLTGELDPQPFLNCSIVHCPSGDHKGDVFTKALDRAPFQAAVKMLGMYGTPRCSRISTRFQNIVRFTLFC
eukprot:861088-Heterocapsa_arctica.AAC.1